MTCPFCNRRMTPRRDGRRRKHRTFDSPAAPWCAGSDQPTSQEKR